MTIEIYGPVNPTLGRTMLSAFINANANGDNAFVANVAGKLVHIVYLSVFCEEAVNVTLHETDGSTARSEVFKFADATGIAKGSTAPGSAPIYSSVTSGKGIDVHVSSASKDVGVSCVYYTE